MASPLVRVPDDVRPYVTKLIALKKAKAADEALQAALQAIVTAKTFDEAIAPLLPLPEKRKRAS